MDGSDHYRKAEELAAKAEKYLGQGDGQESAAVWAAVAQVHATLALAVATTANPERRQQAPHTVVQPSHSAGAGWSGVVEKESTRWMREQEDNNSPQQHADRPESNREPDSAPEYPDPFEGA